MTRSAEVRSSTERFVSRSGVIQPDVAEIARKFAEEAPPARKIDVNALPGILLGRRAILDRVADRKSQVNRQQTIVDSLRSRATEALDRLTELTAAAVSGDYTTASIQDEIQDAKIAADQLENRWGLESKDLQRLTRIQESHEKELVRFDASNGELIKQLRRLEDKRNPARANSGGAVFQ